MDIVRLVKAITSPIMGVVRTVGAALPEIVGVDARLPPGSGALVGRLAGELLPAGDRVVELPGRVGGPDDLGRRLDEVPGGQVVRVGLERLMVLAASLIIVGIQIFFSSFLLSILGLRRRS